MVVQKISASAGRIRRRRSRPASHHRKSLPDVPHWVVVIVVALLMLLLAAPAFI